MAGGEGAACRAPARLREAAFERFAATGLPHRRVEEWKYTDLRALMRDAKPLAPRPDAAVFARRRMPAPLLGDLDAAASSSWTATWRPSWTDRNSHDPGMAIMELFAWLAESPLYVDRLSQNVTDDVAVALNTAFMGDGAVIHVRKRREQRAADPSRAVFSGKTAAATYSALGGDRRDGRAAHADREPRGARRASTIRSTPRCRSSRARAPMSITSRSPARATRRCISRL